MIIDVKSDIDFWKQLQKKATSKHVDSMILTGFAFFIFQSLFWLLFFNRYLDAGSVRQFIATEVIIQMLSIAGATMFALYAVDARNGRIMYDEPITQRPSPRQYVTPRTVCRNVLWSLLAVVIVLAADFIMMHAISDYSFGGWLFLAGFTVIMISIMAAFKSLEP